MSEQQAPVPHEIFKDVQHLYTSTLYGDLIYQAAFLERQADTLRDEARKLRWRASGLESTMQEYSA